MTTTTTKIALTTCLWFDKNAEEAAKFYAKTFPDSRVGTVLKSPSDYPNGKAGDVLTVEFRVHLKSWRPLLPPHEREEREGG